MSADQASVGVIVARQSVESRIAPPGHQGLILQDEVNLVTTFATPETVDPVADRAKLSACLACRTTAPSALLLRPQGDPKKGFDWTYNYFFSAVNMAEA